MAQPCARCRGEDEKMRGDRASLRGLRHRKMHVALDDGQALAQFLTIFPAALSYDALAYAPQGEGLDPQPHFVSGLALLKYGMWAADHAVGTPAEACALVWMGLALSTALSAFAEGRPGLASFQSPQALARALAIQEHPEIQLTPAVLRLAGLP